jgi:transaldolase
MTEGITPLDQVADAGVAVWLDDLSRERLRTGNLKDLVAERRVVGVTTNPTIFASALAKGESYDEQLTQLRAQGTDVDGAVFAITTPRRPSTRPARCGRPSTGRTCSSRSPRRSTG